MGATKKVKFTGSETDNAFLQTMSGNAPTKAASETTPPAHATAETGSRATNTASTEKVLVNFKMSKASLERLRAYCRENDMTLTAGIKRAIRKMLDE